MVIIKWLLNCLKIAVDLFVFVDTDGAASADGAADDAGHAGETADSSLTECGPGTSWFNEHDLGHRGIYS